MAAMRAEHRSVARPSRGMRSGAFAVLFALASALLPAAAAGAGFDLNEYVVRGNSLLAPEEIEDALGGHMGPGRTLEDVHAARDSLQQAYQVRGYQSVVVDLPEQKVVGGVILLQVQEMRVGQLSIEGARWTSEEAVRREVPSLREGAVPDFDQAQKELTAANRPDRQVVPLLRPGTEPGTVDVSLKVDDRLPVHGSLTVNNDHSADTEELRMSATVSHNDVWQRGHSLSLTFFGAPENFDHAKVWVANYSAPLPDNSPWTLQLNAYKSESNVSTLGSTNVLGNGYSVGLRALRRLAPLGDWQQTLSLGIDYNDFEEEVRLGSDGSVVPIRYSPLSLGYSAWRVDERWLNQVELGLKGGFRSLGWGSDWNRWDAKRYQAKSNFLVLKGDLSSTYSFASDWQLAGRATLQLANGPLISNEQLAAGGLYTVRGYLSAEATGDLGAVASLELRTPALGRERLPWVSDWRLYTFVDGASLRLRKPLPEQDDRFELLSLGLGSSLSLTEHLNARFDWGYALREAQHTESGDIRFNFSLRASF